MKNTLGLLILLYIVIVSCNKEIPFEQPDSQNVSDTISFYSGNDHYCIFKDAYTRLSSFYVVKWNTGDSSNYLIVNKPGIYTASYISSDYYGHHYNKVDTFICEYCDYGLNFPAETFTPNGDSQNDYFPIEGYGVINFEMKILNSEGKVVFTSSDINNFWFGTDQNGKRLPYGSYFCLVKAKFLDKSTKYYKKEIRLIL